MGDTADRTAVFDQTHNFDADDLSTREMSGDNLQGAIVVLVTVDRHQDHVVCHQLVAVGRIGKCVFSPLGYAGGLVDFWHRERDEGQGCASLCCCTLQFSVR